MPTLRELQCDMVATLLFGGSDAFKRIVEGPERLDIYRNTVESVLSGALRLSFPIVDKLVGEAFFDATALAFARTFPPVTGCLNDWGQDFPAFLETFAPAQSLAYLPDMARLEWAIATAANAPDVPVLPPAKASLPLRPHPSFSLLSVRWPVVEIRRAVLDDDFSSLALVHKQRWLAISRLGEDVLMRPLSATAADFTQSLLDNQLDGVDPGLATVLAEHLLSGCFQETAS